MGEGHLTHLIYASAAPSGMDAAGLASILRASRENNAGCGVSGQRFDPAPAGQSEEDRDRVRPGALA